MVSIMGTPNPRIEARATKHEKLLARVVAVDTFPRSWQRRRRAGVRNRVLKALVSSRELSEAGRDLAEATRLSEETRRRIERGERA